MRASKKELFVVVIKGQSVHFGLYKFVRGFPQGVHCHEQIFLDGTIDHGHIFNLPLFADAIPDFLSLKKRDILTVICCDHENNSERVVRSTKEIEESSESAQVKYSAIQLLSCCDPLQRISVWQFPYHIIFQYKLLFTLLHCRLITITSPLQSLIYLNHHYGEKQHRLQFFEDEIQRTTIEQLYFARIPNAKNSLDLYSFAAAHMGVNIR